MVVSLLFAICMTVVSALSANAQPCPEVESQRGAWKGTPLHEAINRNDVDAVRDRLTATTLKERDSFGNTPLIAALTPSAALEPAGVVKADTARARIQAEQSARLTIVSALLAKGASVNERGAEGVTPLTQLAGWGFSPAADRRLTDQFLRLGADVNARDDFGSTALMLAASRGKAGLVKLLLSQGADPAAKNCRGDTAASLAQVGGYRAVARVLSTYAPRPR